MEDRPGNRWRQSWYKHLLKLRVPSLNLVYDCKSKKDDDQSSGGERVSNPKIEDELFSGSGSLSSDHESESLFGDRKRKREKKKKRKKRREARKIRLQKRGRNHQRLKGSLKTETLRIANEKRCCQREGKAGELGYLMFIYIHSMCSP